MFPFSISSSATLPLSAGEAGLSMSAVVGVDLDGWMDGRSAWRVVRWTQSKQARAPEKRPVGAIDLRSVSRQAIYLSTLPVVLEGARRPPQVRQHVAGGRVQPE